MGAARTGEAHALGGVSVTADHAAGQSIDDDQRGWSVQLADDLQQGVDIGAVQELRGHA